MKRLILALLLVIAGTAPFASAAQADAHCLKHRNDAPQPERAPGPTSGPAITYPPQAPGSGVFFGYPPEAVAIYPPTGLPVSDSSRANDAGCTTEPAPADPGYNEKE
jgi:hypothetical protein